MKNFNEYNFQLTKLSKILFFYFFLQAAPLSSIACQKKNPSAFYDGIISSGS